MPSKAVQTEPKITWAPTYRVPLRQKLGLGDRHAEDCGEETVAALLGDVTFRPGGMKGAEPMPTEVSGETIVSDGLAALSRSLCDAHQSNPSISTLQLLRAHYIKVRTDVAVNSQAASTMGEHLRCERTHSADHTCA
jgi:hypothetical protein